MGTIPEQYGKLAAFASLRKPAWHGLGTVFDKPVTTVEMLDLAHMSGWNLHFVDPAEVMADYTFAKPILHVVRDNPFVNGQLDVLGTVGSRYKIFSNEEIFDFGDALTSDARRWETAGSMDGGATVFSSLVSHDDIVLDPNGQADTIRKYILLSSSHDGSSTMIAKKVNTRVVCQNTLNVAMAEAGAEFKIRHTQGMAQKIEDAKRALGFAEVYDAAFEAEATAMIQTEVSDATFWKIVEDIFPRPEKDAKGAVKKWENRTDRLTATWNGSTGSMDNLDRNAWRAFQALTEDNQWARQVRSNNGENYFAAGAGFDGPTNGFRNMALSRVKALV